MPPRRSGRRTAEARTKRATTPTNEEWVESDKDDVAVTTISKKRGRRSRQTVQKSKPVIEDDSDIGDEEQDEDVEQKEEVVPITTTGKSRQQPQASCKVVKAAVEQDNEASHEETEIEATPVKKGVNRFKPISSDIEPIDRSSPEYHQGNPQSPVKRTRSDITQESPPTPSPKKKRTVSRRDETPYNSDNDSEMGSPRKKRAIREMHDKNEDDDDNPFLDDTPATPTKTSNAKKSYNEAIKAMIDCLSACEITTDDTPLDALLASTYDDAPFLKTPCSIHDEVNVANFSNGMKICNIKGDALKAFIDLVTGSSYGSNLINSARADPVHFKAGLSPPLSGSTTAGLYVLMTAKEASTRIACTTFGFLSNCNLVDATPMNGKGSGSMIKSCSISPFAHEWDRTLGFLDMIFHAHAPITVGVFNRTLSFTTIPVRLEGSAPSEANALEGLFSNSPARGIKAPPRAKFATGNLSQVLKYRTSLSAADKIPVYDATSYFLPRSKKIAAEFSLNELESQCKCMTGDPTDNSLVAAIHTVSLYRPSSGGLTYKFNILALVVFAHGK
ncbi:hypothetical protein K474DRAFT_1744085 [Panus rudis PR-1116 ss-1]|nr:hypothetical protein K474DRAFT_1744085 [Panus rudis PR-1116 ss-1]